MHPTDDPPRRRLGTPRYREPGRLQAHALAVGLTVVALVVTLASATVLRPTVFLLFFPAVAVSAWYGGRGPAATASVLSVLAANYFLIAPVRSLGVADPWVLIRLGIFLAVGLLIGSLAESLRSVRRAESRRADELARAATESARLLESERAARERFELLSEAGRILSTDLALGSTLDSLASFTTGTLSDYTVVYLLDEDGGTLHRAATAHASTTGAELVRRLLDLPPPATDDPGVRGVLEDGRTLFVPEATEAQLAGAARTPEELETFLALRPRSYILAPLMARDRIIGALAVCTMQGGRLPYAEEDVALVEELARRAGMAVDNARLFEEAEQANLVKSEFLSSMSHELRTPLNAIAGYLDLLDAGILGPLSEAQRDALARARGGQSHLLRLITDVLHFAKLEAGQLPIERRDVPVRSLLTSLDALVGSQAQQESVRFSYHDVPDDLTIRADGDRARQVLLNLVGNGLKFTPPGGSVRVEVHAADGQVHVHVHDEGPGIPEERHEAIFDPFTQFDEGPADPRRGVGLGLSISRELARGMGGDVTVRSATGSGSVFTLTLERGGLVGEDEEAAAPAD